jgi:hypothetical protein
MINLGNIVLVVVNGEIKNHAWWDPVRKRYIFLVWQEIRQPKGNMRVGFSPRKIGNFEFHVHISVIRD